MKDKLKTWEEAVIWMRNQPQYKDLFIACYYDDPITETAVRFYKSSEWQEVKKKLPAKHGIALDIGSGRGISSYALAKDGWTVIAGEPDNSKIVGTGSIKKLFLKQTCQYMLHKYLQNLSLSKIIHLTSYTVVRYFTMQQI